MENLRTLMDKSGQECSDTKPHLVSDLNLVYSFKQSDKQVWLEQSEIDVWGEAINVMDFVKGSTIAAFYFLLKYPPYMYILPQICK